MSQARRRTTTSGRTSKQPARNRVATVDKLAKAAMSKEMLAAGLTAAAAAISASPAARRKIKEAGLDAADAASQAASSVASSATTLGSIIAEAVADAAQRVMSGKWAVEANASRETSSRIAGNRMMVRSTASGRMKSTSRKSRPSATKHRIYEETISEHIGVKATVEADLVSEVRAMVAQSGAPENFDASQWVHDWVRQEIPALDGKRPLDLLDSPEGCQLVMTTLARMQSGAYA